MPSVVLHETAPGKLNLTLDVLGRRADGYHDLEMVMISVSLADEVTLELGTGGDWSVTCDRPDIPAGPENLCWKAARAYCDAAGVDPGGLSIRIQKNVPAQAGMAGGSSDAAAVLRALNRHYGAFSEEALRALGLTVGSDVPYCLFGGVALARGRGEVLTRLPDLPPELRFVLAKPEFSVSTPALFREIDACRDARDQGSGIRDQGTGDARDQGTGDARDQGSGIRACRGGHWPPARGTRFRPRNPRRDQGSGIRDQGTGDASHRSPVTGHQSSGDAPAAPAICRPKTSPVKGRGTGLKAGGGVVTITDPPAAPAICRPKTSPVKGRGTGLKAGGGVVTITDPPAAPAICRPADKQCLSLHPDLPSVRPDAQAMLAAIGAGDCSAIGACLQNAFEPLVAARWPIVEELRQVMLAQGALGARLTGTGSVVFGLYDSEPKAGAAAAALRKLCPEVFTAEALQHRQSADP